MTWNPINPKHAIERVRIVVPFAPEMPPKVVDSLGKVIDSRSQAWNFSRRDPNPTVDMAFDQQGQAMIRTRQGWVLRRQTTPGKTAEAVVLDPVSLIYESSEYLAWEAFSERFLTVCDEILKRIESDMNVEVVSLEYWDRFLHDPVNIVPPHGLFRPEIIALLPQQVVSGRASWHLHKGWFHEESDRRFLVNQNIDIQNVAGAATEDNRTVALYTKVDYRPASKNLDLAKFRDDIDAMHTISNRVVGEALDDEMRKKIGLVL